MDPNLWGPHAWYFIESAVLTMPDDPSVVPKYIDFLMGLQHVLPCRGCRENYADHIKDKPPTNITTKAELVKWVLTLHNDVRDFQKKPKRTHEEVIAYYSKQKPTSSRGQMLHMAVMVMMCIAIIVLLVIVLRLKQKPTP